MLAEGDFSGEERGGGRAAEQHRALRSLAAPRSLSSFHRGFVSPRLKPGAVAMRWRVTQPGGHAPRAGFDLLLRVTTKGRETGGVCRVGWRLRGLSYVTWFSGDLAGSVVGLDGAEGLCQPQGLRGSA